MIRFWNVVLVAVIIWPETSHSWDGQILLPGFTSDPSVPYSKPYVDPNGKGAEFCVFPNDSSRRCDGTSKDLPAPLNKIPLEAKTEEKGSSTVDQQENATLTDPLGKRDSALAFEQSVVKILAEGNNGFSELQSVRAEISNGTDTETNFKPNTIGIEILATSTIEQKIADFESANRWQPKSDGLVNTVFRSPFIGDMASASLFGMMYLVPPIRKTIFGPANSVSLDSVGLGKNFVISDDQRSIGGVVARALLTLNDTNPNFASTGLKESLVQFTASVSEASKWFLDDKLYVVSATSSVNSTFVTGLYSLGRSTLHHEALCLNGSCSFRYQIRDSFSDPTELAGAILRKYGVDIDSTSYGIHFDFGVQPPFKQLVPSDWSKTLDK